jgi:CheY-like chemotaxis protein
MVKQTILLVDDDVNFVKDHKLLLEKNNYDVWVAYNGTQCIEMLEERGNPDLIILDVIMDYGSEGFDVARKLRNNEKTKHIPLIMLTSVGEGFTFKYKPDETWLPVDVFLEKPCPPDKLLGEIKKTID